MTKENKLEDLRNRKKKLSQEQVAIKMGLYGKREGSARDAISKFENGTTKNWGLLNVMQYANAIEASLDEIVMALYPDEPYCSSLLAKEERKLEFMGENQSANAEEEVIEENNVTNRDIFRGNAKKSLIIGPSGYKRHKAMMSEIENAMRQGENLFIVSSDIDAEKILELTVETGHEVYVFSDPCKYLHWEDCIADSQSLAALAASIVHKTKGRIDNPEELICILYNIMMQVQEENGGKISLSKVCEKIIKESKKKRMDNETKNKLAFINIILTPYMYKTDDKVSLINIMKEKHIIIFDAKHYSDDVSTYSLILEQYIRQIYSLSGEKNVYYHIIADEMGTVFNLPEHTVMNIIATCRRHNISITAAVHSLEELQNNYRDCWLAIHDNFTKKILLNLGKSTMSAYAEKIYGNINKEMVATPEKSLVVENGKEPYLIEF